MYIYVSFILTSFQSEDTKAQSTTPELLMVEDNEAIINVLRSLGVNYSILRPSEQPVDTWVRDWGPVANHYFKYDLSYARETLTQLTIGIERRNLNQHLDLFLERFRWSWKAALLFRSSIVFRQSDCST